MVRSHQDPLNNEEVMSVKACSLFYLHHNLQSELLFLSFLFFICNHLEVKSCLLIKVQNHMCYFTMPFKNLSTKSTTFFNILSPIFLRSNNFGSFPSISCNTSSLNGSLSAYR